MTAIEQAVLAAIGEQAIHKSADDEVSIKALESALDDLMSHQAALQVEADRRKAWLEAIAELSAEKDLESAQALARVALRTECWPPGNRR